MDALTIVSISKPVRDNNTFEARVEILQSLCFFRMTLRRAQNDKRGGCGMMDKGTEIATSFNGRTRNDREENASQ
jgi:hypothetical protein